MSPHGCLEALRDAHDAGALRYRYWTGEPEPVYVVEVCPGRERGLGGADVAGYVIGALDAAGVPAAHIRGLRGDVDAAPTPAPGWARGRASGADAHAARVQLLWEAEAHGLLTYLWATAEPARYAVHARTSCLPAGRVLLAAEAYGYVRALADVAGLQLPRAEAVSARR